MKEFNVFDTFVFWRDYSQKFRDICSESTPDEKIKVNINSPGGDVFEGIALYNVIKEESKNREIEIKVQGLAASIASVVLLASENRSVCEGSMVMIHNPHSFCYGDSRDYKKEIEKLEKVKDSIVNIYESNLSYSRSEIHDFMNQEKWFTTEDCEKSGFGRAVASGYTKTENQLVDRYKFFNNSFKKSPAGEDQKKAILNSEIQPAERQIKDKFLKLKIKKIKERNKNYLNKGIVYGRAGTGARFKTYKNF